MNPSRFATDVWAQVGHDPSPTLVMLGVLACILAAIAASAAHRYAKR